MSVTAEIYLLLVGTVGDLVHDYVIAGVRRGQFTAQTAASYRSILGRFADAMPDDPAKIQRRHVMRWYDQLNCSASTTRHRLSVVKTFCRWAVDAGHMTKDPARGIRAPQQPRHMPRNFDADEVARALAHLDGQPRNQLIIVLMVQLGLRCKEVAELQVGDIDRTHELVLVRGKGNKERVVPLTSEALAALDAYLADDPAAAGVLVRSATGRGLTPGYISDRVRKWLSDAGVKRHAWDGKSAHAFRHTAATDILRAGADVRQVQVILGHGSLQTTQRYLGWQVDDLRAVMEGRRYEGLGGITADGVDDQQSRLFEMG